MLRWCDTDSRTFGGKASSVAYPEHSAHKGLSYWDKSNYGWSERKSGVSLGPAFCPCLFVSTLIVPASWRTYTPEGANMSAFNLQLSTFNDGPIY